MYISKKAQYAKQKKLKYCKYFLHFYQIQQQFKKNEFL